MLEDGLRQAGYDVSVASDTREALALMRSTHVDLVLVDPPLEAGETGPGMLDEINDEFPDVPSIVVAEDVFDPTSLLPSQGGDYHRQRLARPFTLSSLLAAVRRATGGPDGRRYPQG